MQVTGEKAQAPPKIRLCHGDSCKKKDPRKTQATFIFVGNKKEGIFSKSFYETGPTLLFKSDQEYNKTSYSHAHLCVDGKLLNNINGTHQCIKRQYIMTK